jgi:molecular chaperone DnaK
MAKLGQFSFADIPKMPAGDADIEVEFKIDEDGIMHVIANEVSTGKKM